CRFGVPGRLVAGSARGLLQWYQPCPADRRRGPLHRWPERVELPGGDHGAGSGSARAAGDRPLRRRTGQCRGAWRTCPCSLSTAGCSMRPPSRIVSTDPRTLVREDLRDFTGYVSARGTTAAGNAWLNANESPWTNGSPGTERLRRYPDP